MLSRYDGIWRLNELSSNDDEMHDEEDDGMWLRMQPRDDEVHDEEDDGVRQIRMQPRDDEVHDEDDGMRKYGGFGSDG